MEETRQGGQGPSRAVVPRSSSSQPLLDELMTAAVY
jgi:hypothetical protein